MNKKNLKRFHKRVDLLKYVRMVGGSFFSSAVGLSVVIKRHTFYCLITVWFDQKLFHNRFENVQRKNKQQVMRTEEEVQGKGGGGGLGLGVSAKAEIRPSRITALGFQLMSDSIVARALQSICYNRLDGFTAEQFVWSQVNMCYVLIISILTQWRIRFRQKKTILHDNDTKFHYSKNSYFLTFQKVFFLSRNR